ncbi:TetR family transcriptional regulator [Mycolicibacterium arabiense]|uniref:TetR family transcriptional regulator n=1 Tax=Mycolicibacterium arabiense TaxID=1286181 RepID=A0A7I7S1F0_9MYCO|nr:TetR/AcrR family transcriptional regulator [Mycolicibacterium arabiense]MCV7376986.1 TetR/AcrR family transcriptional regulator [Mycolicibacterium arabiense]BBY50744.1 TetR family transcriptional regulator [Mycolicibacterium arabiense]
MTEATTPNRQPATGKRRRRTRSGTDLSRDVYIDSAVNLIEMRGVGVLSARTLAAAVGADPTALYRYFTGIDDVLLAVADRMIGIALDRWTPTDDWLTSLANLARALYRVYANEFPLTGTAIATRTTGLPNEIRAVEITIGLLRDGGFDVEAATRWFRSLSDFLLGQAMLDGAFTALPQQIQDADHDTWRGLPERLTPDDTPHAEAAAHHLRSMMLESSFEASLELILAGLGVMARTSTEGGA